MHVCVCVCVSEREGVIGRVCKHLTVSTAFTCSCTLEVWNNTQSDTSQGLKVLKRGDDVSYMCKRSLLSQRPEKEGASGGPFPAFSKCVTHFFLNNYVREMHFFLNYEYIYIHTVYILYISSSKGVQV